VVEAGEDLAFLAEEVEPAGQVCAGAHELHRNLLRVLAIVALGEVDHAHAALAEQPDQTVGADVGGELGRVAGEGLGGVAEGGDGEDLTGRRLIPEVFIHLRAKGGIPAAGAIEIGRAGGRLQLQGGGQDLLNALPVGGVHGLGASRTWRRSHSRAVAHSRCTVVSETPMASAVSSAVRPP